MIDIVDRLSNMNALRKKFVKPEVRCYRHTRDYTNWSDQSKLYWHSAIQSRAYVSFEQQQ